MGVGVWITFGGGYCGEEERGQRNRGGELVIFGFLGWKSFTHFKDFFETFP